jgi:hypothetical protein
LIPGKGWELFTTASILALRPTQPPIQWVPGALSLGVKWLGCEVDHSPPSNAKVKNAWSYTSTPQYVFMAWYLVKHSDNFTFTFNFTFTDTDTDREHNKDYAAASGTQVHVWSRPQDS